MIDQINAAHVSYMLISSESEPLRCGYPIIGIRVFVYAFESPIDATVF